MDDTDTDTPLSAREIAALDEIVETLASAIRMMEGKPHERLQEMLIEAKATAEKMIGFSIPAVSH